MLMNSTQEHDNHSVVLTYSTTYIIDYGLILYYQSCTDKEKAKCDKIQYSAARLVTSTLPYTSKEK